MKRSADLPLRAEDVYRAILDPLLLAAWWDIPYATTGPSPLHVFEVEIHGEDNSWRFRGFITENEAPRLLRIESEELKKRPPVSLDVRLEPLDEGCRLEVEWESKRLDRLAEAFLDPKGHQRLGLVIDQYPGLGVQTSDSVH